MCLRGGTYLASLKDPLGSILKPSFAPSVGLSGPTPEREYLTQGKSHAREPTTLGGPRTSRQATAAKPHTESNEAKRLAVQQTQVHATTLDTSSSASSTRGSFRRKRNLRRCLSWRAPKLRMLKLSARHTTRHPHCTCSPKILATCSIVVKVRARAPLCFGLVAEKSTVHRCTALSLWSLWDQAKQTPKYFSHRSQLGAVWRHDWNVFIPSGWVGS